MRAHVHQSSLGFVNTPEEICFLELDSVSAEKTTSFQHVNMGNCGPDGRPSSGVGVGLASCSVNLRIRSATKEE